MNTAAFASVVAIAAAPAIAQDTTAPTPSADPFVSTQTGEGAGLSGLAVGGLTLVVIGGVIALVDSDGNVVSTTAAP
ncbi:MAG: hypothetical protein AAF641_04055 [Pseudomonadota bacterium]